MDFKELTKQYLDSVEYEQLEAHSQSMYKIWLERVPEEATISSKSLFAWLKKLKVRASTRNHGLSVVRVVYGWGVMHGLIDSRENVAIHIKRFRSTVMPAPGYTREEINAICDAAQTPSEELCASFLKILFWTGARPSEVLALKWTDIDYSKHLIAIRGAKKREKGEISRYCNLLPVILDCLQDLYEKSRRHNDEGYIFNIPYGMGNRKLHIIYARNLIKKMSKRVGISKDLRQARTGLATSMLSNGYSLTDVQQTLGHKSIFTTQRYIRTPDVEKARVFKGL